MEDYQPGQNKFAVKVAIGQKAKGKNPSTLPLNFDQMEAASALDTRQQSHGDTFTLQVSEESENESRPSNKRSGETS